MVNVPGALLVGDEPMFRISQCIAIGLLTLIFAVPALAQEPVITGVSVEIQENGAELITFDSTIPVAPKKTFTLANPDRVAIDIPLAKGAGVKLPANYTGRLLKAVRFGQFDKDTSRIVLDLQVPVSRGTVTPGAPFSMELSPVTPLPARKTLAKAPDHNADADEDDAPIAKPVTPTPSNKKSPATPEDRKPLIAIDAGHGGQDPGAIGVHETHERDITLNFAHALRTAFLKTGRYRVILTRDDDHYIMLQDRVAIARKAKADLFISMHADSNPRPEAHGLSIYTLSATASDDEAAALAERENKADIITGLNLNTTDADVANILIDLTQRETMNKSTTLADTIVESLHPKITKLPMTHRFAGFRVLKAPDVPSVLIELGFVSNPIDERLLLSPEYRDVVVSSIVKGVDKYEAAQ